jgi:hypothetical protein
MTIAKEEVKYKCPVFVVGIVQTVVVWVWTPCSLAGSNPSIRGTCASIFRVEGVGSSLMLHCQNPEDHSLNSFGY